MNNIKSQVLPFVALRGITVVPGMAIHIDISSKNSIRSIKEAMSDPSGGQRIFVVTQKNLEVEHPRLKDMYEIGTIAVVKQVIKQPDGMGVVVEGVSRGRFDGSFMTRGKSEDVVYAGVVEVPDDKAELSWVVSEGMLRKLRELLRLYALASHNGVQQIMDSPDLKTMLNRIAVHFPMDYRMRQELLEQTTLQGKFGVAAKVLVNETQILQIKDDLSAKVSQLVDKNQREYVLREQLKVIHDELGDSDYTSEADEFRKALEELEASDEVKAKINREINRYKSLQGSTSEANVCRGYIETLLELPWDKATQDNNDIKNARRVLDRDHYGLEKVKERILEYLAVRSFSGNGSGTIICLVGPPGTGKTSIARSVASALGREYVRVCLGGVRDEAEIRGHRKTYVGAMPGRIIEALIQAKVKNPLILLDEIDKVSRDYRSDTSSALLEVLDSQQNSHFRDHYVEIPVDLSQVLFIATANDLSDMPRPLLDRMEVIEVNSYTANEKLAIAQQYLVPRQLGEAGLKKGDIRFGRKALKLMIDRYTREAGVRSLERTIGHVCRKAVTNHLMEAGAGAEFEQLKITEANLSDYLGREKYQKKRREDKHVVGIVTGLAWTAVGGDTLLIEVNSMKGTGKLELTGQMGDVMQESARIAMSCARSIADADYGMDDEAFEKLDFHIHIPDGAVKKDGPSAGITMTVALLSVMTGMKVLPQIAMTGEITLKGRVLPVGGLKEKLLAANVAGIRTVLVPSENRPDIEELDDEIIGRMKIEYVDDIRQAVRLVLR